MSALVLAALLLAAPAAAPAPPRPREDAFKPAPQGVPDKETARAEAALDAGKPELAIEEAKRALAINERHVPAMIALAKAYLQLRKLELVSAILDSAARVDPKSGDVPLLRGFLALEADDPAGAIALFREATERDPRHAAAWNDLGALYVQTKNWDAARSALESAIALAPRFAKAHLNLGSALRGKRDFALAEASYLRALALDPGLDTALFNLGILYLDADPFPGVDPIPQLEKALQHLQQYRTRLGPRLPKEDPVTAYLGEAQKALERLRRLEERKKKRQPQPDAAPTAPRPKG